MEKLSELVIPHITCLVPVIPMAMLAIAKRLKDRYYIPKSTGLLSAREFEDCGRPGAIKQNSSVRKQ